MIAVLLQLRIVSIPLCFVRTLLLLAAGSLLFSLSIAEDNECDLNAINESIEAVQPRGLILNQITEFIKSTNIKRLVLYFAEVYQIPIILVFSGCTACTCLAMLMIQIDLNQVIIRKKRRDFLFPRFKQDLGYMHQSNSLFCIQFTDENSTVMLLESVLFGIWALTLVLVVCEFGEKMSDEYEGVERAINRLDWYRLPTDIQRMLPIMFMYCQEPLIVKFFGSLSVSRCQFKKVNQTLANT